MSDKRFDVLVAGEINPDLILSGEVEPAFGQVEKLVDDAVLTIGSSSAIFACGAARLGLRVAFVGLCGDDVFGRFMLDALRARGVDVSNVVVPPGGRTGLSVILNRGSDRAILTFPGLIDALTAAHIPDGLLRASRHLHVASYFLQTALQPGLGELFQRAHAYGATTSLDTNWDPQASWSGARELLPLVDVFLPNAAEACAVAGITPVEAAAAALAQKAGCVAVKLGAEGGLAARGDESARQPPVQVTVVDTVGAGDSFDAGFVYGLLQGWALPDCLRMAVTCGSLSTRAAGGTTAQPSLDEIDRNGGGHAE